MKLRVYLSGAIIGSYRAQNIIKVLGDSGIVYSYNPSNYLTIDAGNWYLNKIIKVFLLFLMAPFKFFMILLASHVVVLPMNSSLVTVLEFLVARGFRKKIIVDYYMSNYDTFINDRKLIHGGSFRARWSHFKDKLFLNFSDHVVFLNKAESDYYQAVAGVKLRSSKVQVIPLCIDYKKELFQSGENAKHEDDAFYVCWWGTYIPLHGLENIIRAFSNIEDENVKLYLFGNSEQKSEPYKKIVKDLGLEGKIVIINDYSFANGKLAPFLNANCDLAVGNFGDSEKAKTVLVNKLVDSLSLGLPCLTMETKATRELLPNKEGVILAEPTPEDIAKNIKAAFNDRSKLKDVGESGRKKYFETFSPDAFKVKFLSLLHEEPHKL